MGGPVRMDPNVISVSETSAIKQTYRTGSQFAKSDQYSAWQGRRKFDLSLNLMDAFTVYNVG